MSKINATKSKRSNLAENAGFVLLMTIILSLGTLIGREIHRYEVQNTDEVRIRQLIEALEKKPVELKVYPLVPFRVPPRPSDKVTATRTPDMVLS